MSEKKSAPALQPFGYAQALNHVIRNDPALTTVSLRKLLKRSCRYHAKHGQRGSFCLFFESLDKAMSLDAAVQLQWKPRSQLLQFEPLKQIDGFALERSIHVLVVVWDRDGATPHKREVLMHAPEALPANFLQRVRASNERAREPLSLDGELDSEDDETPTCGSESLVVHSTTTANGVESVDYRNQSSSCAVCGAVSALSRCSKCRGVSYCSKGVC